MKFFKDAIKIKHLIEEAIQTYGYAPEHNYYWYQYCRRPNDRNVFVQFRDGTGLLTVEDDAKRTVYLFSQPLAPVEKRMPILLDYLDYVLTKGKLDRVEVELDTGSRRELRHELPSLLRDRAVFETLWNPVMNLLTFDETLPGKHFKSIRHARNSFYSQNQVEIVDANTCGSEKLSRIIDEWRAKRNSHDHVYYDQYYALVRQNFEGTDSARAMIVNGTVAGFNAGWSIPNSSSYYAAVGIHNYAVPDLGQMLYLEDLVHIKRQGFREADMGGSGKNLLAFKNQFHPAFSYRTKFFSIVRREMIPSLPVLSHVMEANT